MTTATSRLEETRTVSGGLTLIVDDRIDMIEAISGALREVADFTDFEVATSVEEAWNIIERRTVAHVVSDWRMPPDDNGGIVFLQDVKRRLPDLRCTLLTGYAHDLPEKSREQLGELGIAVWEKRGLDTVRLVDCLRYNHEPSTQRPFEPGGGSRQGETEMNTDEIIFQQQLVLDRLQKELMTKKDALSRVASDLLEDLRRIRVADGGFIIGKLRTKEEVLREIENLTPLGIRLIELDRTVRRRFTQ